MSTKTKRRLLALALGGTVMQYLYQSGCAQYYAYGAISTFDFCAVLNCEGGTYFDFCSPIPQLVDCPNVQVNP
jgi:hypothetical protein